MFHAMTDMAYLYFPLVIIFVIGAFKDSMETVTHRRFKSIDTAAGRYGIKHYRKLIFFNQIKLRGIQCDLTYEETNLEKPIPSE